MFDFDGTLYGERFPTYFDTCLFLHRTLHDDGYTAAENCRKRGIETVSMRDEFETIYGENADLSKEELAPAA